MGLHIGSTPIGAHLPTVSRHPGIYKASIASTLAQYHSRFPVRQSSVCVCSSVTSSSHCVPLVAEWICRQSKDNTSHISIQAIISGRLYGDGAIVPCWRLICIAFIVASHQMVKEYIRPKCVFVHWELIVLSSTLYPSPCWPYSIKSTDLYASPIANYFDQAKQQQQTLSLSGELSTFLSP